MSVATRLSPRRTTMRLSVVEGALYAGMVGLGEFWFLADNVRLGAGPFALAAIVTLPQLVGALGAVSMLRLLRSASHRRPLVVGAVVGQAAGLTGLATLSALHLTTPSVLILMACAHQLFGQAAGTAWASWFGEVVPSRVRGRWFGGRNRWVHGTTFAGILVGGLVLQALEPSAAAAADGAPDGPGYALLYGTAALLRLACAAILARSWEPGFERPEATDDLAGVLVGSEAAGGRGVVIASGAMLLAVCVSSPFFAPHMLDTLRFSYALYLAAQGVLVLSKVAALPAWGRLVDRVGAVPAYRAAALMVAVIPIPWVFADRAWIVFLAQAMSGLAWAGHEVALFTLTLSAVGPRKRAVLLTALSLSNGTAQFAGGLVGTALAGSHAATAFATSAGLRIAVALTAPLLLAPLSRTPATEERAARVVGWRPHGGVARQLVAATPRREPRVGPRGAAGQESEHIPPTGRDKPAVGG